VVFFEECQSTNTEAAALAADGAAAGTLVVADAQSGGKGRLGRSWISPPGENLYFSLLLRPSLPPEQAGLLGLACAVGVAEALDLGIKWPNDVLDPERRKIAGILSEMEVEKGAILHVVLGVGINVNQVQFDAELPQAGSLARLRGPQDRGQVLARCLAAIEQRCAQTERSPDTMLDAWRNRWLDRGRQVQAESCRGIAVDVGPDGSLILQTDQGLQSVFAGDVAPVSGDALDSAPGG
jgi:BirA family biotin operon repressor/biotin-[acetyl-CoA-carboxylase] ligase